jgi:hypothetical protein
MVKEMSMIIDLTLAGPVRNLPKRVWDGVCLMSIHDTFIVVLFFNIYGSEFAMLCTSSKHSLLLVLPCTFISLNKILLWISFIFVGVKLYSVQSYKCSTFALYTSDIKFNVACSYVEFIFLVGKHFCFNADYTGSKFYTSFTFGTLYRLSVSICFDI